MTQVTFQCRGTYEIGINCITINHPNTLLAMILIATNIDQQSDHVDISQM